MKIKALLILTTIVLLCSCSSNKDNKEQIPAELKMIKNHFSVIYKISLLNKNNDKVMQNDEENIVATSIGLSLSSNDSETQFISFDKNQYYIKECLKDMENLRVALSDKGIDSKLINGLDNSVNRMAHYMNEKNTPETMRAANDGIYIIGTISEHYTNKKSTDVLKLEYCLNLIETEAENVEDLNKAIELTKTVVIEMSSSAIENKKEWERILKSLESIKLASIYSDEQLIRTKVGIIRENLDEITDLE